MSKLKKVFNVFSLLKDDYKELTPIVFINGIVSAIIPFLDTYLFAKIVNEVLNKNFDTTIKYVLILVIGTFILSVIKTISDSKIMVCRMNADNTLERLLDKKAYLIRYEEYDKKETLEKVRLIKGKMNGAGGMEALIFYFKSLISNLIKTILALVFVVYMFYSLRNYSFLNEISFYLTIVSFIVCIIMSFYVNDFVEKQFNDEQKANVKSNAIFSYNIEAGMDINNKKDIMLYDLNKLFNKYTTDHKYNAYEIYTKESYLEGIGGLIGTSFISIFTLFAYVFVCINTLKGGIDIGDVLLYVSCLTLLSSTFKSVIENYTAMAYRSDYLNEIYEFINDDSLENKGKLNIDLNNHEIEFKDVSFKYPGSNEYVLKDINIKLDLNKKLALVGRNGSGKSTIVKLLCGLYVPSAGEILLNGKNINKYKYEEYIKLFSPVFQDYKILSLPIKDNVATSLNIDEDKVIDSINRVGLSERISKLDEGINTKLNNDNGVGINLSGGEGQRLAIARALYKDAPIVILDEPTAALDPIVESQIYEKFSDLTKNKTSIYISHRMSSCKFCDRIIVLKNGQIVQEGTHDSLLNKEGEYASLFNAQAKYYTEQS